MKAPLGLCFNCFALGSLYYPEYNHYACPKHAKQLSLWDESKAHLLGLMAPSIKAWYAHWLERGLTQDDLDSAFEHLEPDLLKIVHPGSEDD